MIMRIEQGSIKMLFTIKDSNNNLKTVNLNEIEEVIKNSHLSDFKIELKLHSFLKYCNLSP